jgi:hypothetical protein
MVSLSDVQTPAGWTKIQVIWDLSVTAVDSGSCRFTNQVLSYPTPAFLETLQVAGISFEDAVADRQIASDDHNRRETALYAQSLERKALARPVTTGVVRSEINAGRTKRAARMSYPAQRDLTGIEKTEIPLKEN